MKKILLIAFAFIATSSLYAQDFIAGGIRYTVTSTSPSLTVAVAVQDPNNIKGSAVIPATVSYSGETFSVKSILNNAFLSCTGLTSVSIPSSVISMGVGVFRDCNGLTSVSIPSSVTTISGTTFFGCTGLTSVSIPSSVTTIGSSAFRDCTSLTSVNIPSSVTTIGGRAFQGCTGLTSVTVNWATPITITADVFTGVTLSNVTLNIPTGTLAAYQAVAVWKDFSNIKATLANESFENTANINLYPNPSTGIFNLQLVNDLQIEVYNSLGQLLLSEKMISGNNTINIADKAAGIYFVKANDGNNVSTYKMIKN